MWQELGVALCLVLVLEGIVPFVQPSGWRKAVSAMSKIDDGSMRFLGFVSMAAGTIMLYIIH